MPFLAYGPVGYSLKIDFLLLIITFSQRVAVTSGMYKDEHDNTIDVNYILTNKQNTTTTTTTTTKPKLYIHIGPHKTGTTTIQDLSAIYWKELLQDDIVFHGKINRRLQIFMG
jgi:hypothetical protein